MTDLADYLGKKYGGWFDLALLYGTKWKTNDWISHADRRRHRTDGVSHVLGQAGRLRQRSPTISMAS